MNDKRGPEAWVLRLHQGGDQVLLYRNGQLGYLMGWYQDGSESPMISPNHVFRSD